MRLIPGSVPLAFKARGRSPLWPTRFISFKMVEKISIKLTPQEENLFQRLLSVLEANQKQTILRVNGGWVRDKVRRGAHSNRLSNIFRFSVSRATTSTFA